MSDWEPLAVERSITRDAGGWALFLSSFDVLGILAAVVAAFGIEAAKALARPPEVNLASGLLRHRGRVMSFSQIEIAALIVEGVGSSRVLILQFGTERIRFDASLRKGAILTLKATTATQLLGILGGSSITLPESRWDPKGKFTRYNFPGRISKDEALALVENPPAPGEPLPIAD